MPARVAARRTAGDRASAARRRDLSLWRCLVRELSEELLGAPEVYDSADAAFDYDCWPLHKRLTAARRAGKLGVWCLGLGVDPLTLATDILTVAVFDADIYHAVVADLTPASAEGRLLAVDGSAQPPFAAGTVARFSGGGEPVQPAGAAVLRLAWQHRGTLLG